MAKIIIDVKDIINMTDTYTVAEYAEGGRTIAEWVETLGKLEEALKKLKQETRLARTEWDYAKAAGIRKAAEILEEALGGPQDRTSELIKKIKTTEIMQIKDE